KLALEHVRLDEVGGRRVLALLQIVELDEPLRPDALGELRDEILLGALAVETRRFREVEGAERLLELAPHALERRVRVCGDHRADELERKPDRTGLERRQARRRAEGVAE